MKSLLNAREGAEYLGGISYWKFLEMCKAGILPNIHLGNRVFVRRETIDEWLLEQEKMSISN
jgi:hypothetical protein